MVDGACLGNQPEVSLSPLLERAVDNDTEKFWK